MHRFYTKLLTTIKLVNTRLSSGFPLFHIAYYYYY
nr:MAG TPA: hypothetical protein [Caudoviricetes sp.]